MGASTSSRAVAELVAMQGRRYPFKDPGLALDPPILSHAPDDVAEVYAEADYRLHVRFFDGTTGYVELKDRILSPNAKAFATLANPDVFAQVGIGFGTVMWANGIDLAPDTMYDAIKRDGYWVLR